MHPVNLIASGLPLEDPDYPCADLQPSDGICAITGLAGQCVPRKSLLGKSFCDGDTLAAPNSSMVSMDAYIALKYKWERMSSWMCGAGGFKKLNRVEVRDVVLSGGGSTPWCGYATTSYKKHGALRAPINYSAGQNKWLFESRIVDCSDSAKMIEWWSVLNDAIRIGIGRSIMDSMDCPSIVMRKVGLQKWMEFEEWAKPKKSSALYAFLVYLLPSQEELKNEKRDEDNGVDAPCQKPLF